jgi:hypothetical protein
MSEAIEIRFVGDMERLVLRPGDRFVLKVDQHYPNSVHEHIQKAWREFAGEPKLLILGPGMTLGAIGSEDAG